MKILFLDQFSELGGAQQCLLDLVDGLARDPLMDELFAGLPAGGPLVEALSRRGVTVEELPRLEYSNGRKSAFDFVRFASNMPVLRSRIRRMIRQHGIDLVYVNGPRPLPAASMAAKTTVFHAHSFLDKRYASALARWSVRHSDARIIASSQFVAKPFPDEAVRVIYNGVREIPFRPREPVINRPYCIGTLGRIAPEKGQEEFVRAARILKDRGVKAEYRVHGAPMFSDSSYFERVRELSAGLPIRFPGWSNDVSEVFAELDLLVVSSTWIDANPRVIPEAFSAGVPVVAYPSGGIPELIEDGVTGVLTHSLTDAIEQLLANRERMISIAFAARQAWEQRFTVQRYVREVREFLATLQTGSRGRQQSPAATLP